MLVTISKKLNTMSVNFMPRHTDGLPLSYAFGII